uniref:Putative farnesoic acid 0-methyl transferase n=1 Tax=Psorophora albipes TaxID=869069 RepID=T1D4N0_9DIPT
MFLLFWSSIVLSVLLGHYANGHINKFEATVGCSQYNSNQGYNFAHPYFATGGFRNLQVDRNGVRRIRLGVLGNNDGHIRLAPVQFPYDRTVMNEIVLSGWDNTKTVVRRYTRTAPSAHTGQVVLKEQSSIGMMSQFEPLMFTLAVHPDGTVQFTNDKDSRPFLEFKDASLSANYVSFCNWDLSLVFFYDCPLEQEQQFCEGGLVLKKKYEELTCVKNGNRSEPVEIGN